MTFYTESVPYSRQWRKGRLSISPDHLHTVVLSQHVGGGVGMYTCVCGVEVGMEERQGTLTEGNEAHTH